MYSNCEWVLHNAQQAQGNYASLLPSVALCGDMDCLETQFITKDNL